jgi:hypothetical protein
MAIHLLVASNPPPIEGILFALIVFIVFPIVAVSLLITSVVLIRQSRRKASVICVVLALLSMIPPVLLALR